MKGAQYSHGLRFLDTHCVCFNFMSGQRDHDLGLLLNYVRQIALMEP